MIALYTDGKPNAVAEWVCAKFRIHAQGAFSDALRVGWAPHTAVVYIMNTSYPQGYVAMFPDLEPRELQALWYQVVFEVVTEKTDSNEEGPGQNPGLSPFWVHDLFLEFCSCV